MTASGAITSRSEQPYRSREVPHCSSADSQSSQVPAGSARKPRRKHHSRSLSDLFGPADFATEIGRTFFSDAHNPNFSTL